MLVDPLFYTVAIPAVILLGLAKGGFSGLGLAGVPLMALAVSPVQAASILLPILIVQDAVSVWAFRRTWDRRALAVTLPGAVAGIALGYALAAYVSTAAVELAVGLISMIFALQRLWTARRPLAPVSHAPAWFGLACGAAAGFTSQIAHAGGPPFHIFLLPRRLDRDVFVGTSALFFAVVNWIKVPAYAALGQFTSENLLAGAVLAPLAVASTWAGVLLVRRVSGARFYTLIYVLLVLVGAKLVFDGASGLAA